MSEIYSPFLEIQHEPVTNMGQKLTKGQIVMLTKYEKWAKHDGEEQR